MTNKISQFNISEHSPSIKDILNKPHQIDSSLIENCTSACTTVHHLQISQSTDDIRAFILKTQHSQICNNDISPYPTTNNLRVRRRSQQVSSLPEGVHYQHKPLESRLSNSCLDMKELQARGISVGGQVVGIEYPEGSSAVVGVWTLGLGLLGDSESYLCYQHNVLSMLCPMNLLHFD